MKIKRKNENNSPKYEENEKGKRNRKLNTGLMGTIYGAGGYYAGKVSDEINHTQLVESIKKATKEGDIIKASNLKNKLAENVVEKGGIKKHLSKNKLIGLGVGLTAAGVNNAILKKAGERRTKHYEETESPKEAIKKVRKDGRIVGAATIAPIAGASFYGLSRGLGGMSKGKSALMGTLAAASGGLSGMISGGDANENLYRIEHHGNLRKKNSKDKK